MDWNKHLDRALDEIRDTFGQEVLYLGDEAKPPIAIQAVFDTAHRSDKLDYQGLETFETRLSSLEPQLFVKLADLPRPPGQGDEVSIDGTWYQVIDVELDGSGGANLVLQLC